MLIKILKILLAVVVVAFIGIQFVRIDKTNPAINPNETLESAVAVPPEVSAILQRSCNDCHSHNTVYPWYSNIAPMSWMLKSHIDDGRKDLNFSIFNTYADNRKSKKIEKICDEVQSREMPLPSYLWIHRDAVMSDADIKTLCDWTKAVGEKQ